MYITRPEISIILLTYNREASLRKAVESVYSQTFKDFELIILDNGSTSPTYFDSIQDFIIEKENLKFLRFEENTPFLGNRLNQGLSISNGRYITFLMDDDFLTKNALMTLHHEISKGFDFVYGKVKTVDFISGLTVKNSYATTDWSEGVNTIHITSVIIKKDIFDSIGGFCEIQKRFYDLDLWRRIFKIAKTNRIDKIISEVSVNNLNSASSATRSEHNPIGYAYPLIKYWSDRKSVSFSYNEKEFIDLFNTRNLPWVSVIGNPLDTDCGIYSEYIDGIHSYTPTKFYYIKNPSKVNPTMLNLCSGVISPIKIDTEKPSHVLRPTITHEALTQLDNIDYLYQKCLNILCLDIPLDSFDFLKEVLVKLKGNFSTIFFNFYPNPDVRKLLTSIPGVIPNELNDNSYSYLKSQNIDTVLNIISDYNNYSAAYDAILKSIALRAPLVSYDNIAFRDILFHEKDIFIAKNIQTFYRFTDDTKDVFIRENMVKNMRKKTYLYFLDQVIIDNFVLFLNKHFIKTESVLDGTLLIDQTESNSSVLIQSGNSVTQCFTPKEESFNCIQFFGKVLCNVSTTILLVIRRGNTIILETDIPSFRLKNGTNTIIFENIITNGSDTFSFTLSASTPIFYLDKTDYVMSEGVCLNNGLPKKDCLKFKVWKEASYIIKNS